MSGVPLFLKEIAVPIYSRTNLALSVRDKTVGSTLRYDHFVVEADGEGVLMTLDWADAVATYWEYRESCDQGLYDFISIAGIVVC